MASYDGGGFEEWVRDSLYGTITEEKIQRVIALLEPYRETIENGIDGYEEEEHSWRDYRNALWDRIPDDVQKQVDEILEERRSRLERI